MRIKTGYFGGVLVVELLDVPLLLVSELLLLFSFGGVVVELDVELGVEVLLELVALVEPLAEPLVLMLSELVELELGVGVEEVDEDVSVLEAPEERFMSELLRVALLQPAAPKHNAMAVNAAALVSFSFGVFIMSPQGF